MTIFWHWIAEILCGLQIAGLSFSFCPEPVEEPFEPYCDGYDYYGEGGAYEPNSPSCGYNPPAAGTLSDSYCEGYTRVLIYNDGAYGFYEARIERSDRCGYLHPTLEVEIDNAFGDRFRPVVVYVDYREQGKPAGWSYEVPYGEVEAFDDRLHIYGDGLRHEDLSLTINGVEFLYQLRPEPRCGAVDPYTDCAGYRYRGDPDGYIYYGEDDETVVEWSMGYVYYDRSLEPYEFVVSDGSDAAWGEASRMVAQMNEVYADAGVHVRLVLEPSAVGFGRYMSNAGHTAMTRSIGSADVAIGRGTTCADANGCARVSTSFVEGSGFTVAGTIASPRYLVALHELGHMVGLAHGPDNLSMQKEGYIWPDFGHGHSTPFCGRVSDLMSYDWNGMTHNNSRLNCGDGSPAGDRSYADSAYHLNRVRYDVSLIGAEPSVRQSRKLPPEGPLIFD